MNNRYTDHDQEHYERPRRRTRPRTKDRPTYDDAVDGVVVTVDRGRFTLLIDGATVMAMKSRPLGRKGVVVGDRVRVVGDVSGVDGSLARIVEVVPRTTTLRRTADDDDPVERVIVSNADQLVVVTALADPEPRPRLIDRALVAAFDAGMSPLLCLTKADLADPEVLLSTYRSLGVPWVVTERGGDLAEVRDRLRGRTSVLVGHSGVGKSTLVNALIPDANRDVGRRQRGHRSRPPHLDLGLPAGAPGPDGGRRLDHRHPGHPVVRARARAARGPDQRLPRPRGDDRGLPARDAPTAPTSPSAGSTSRSPSGESDPDRVESFRRLLTAREGALTTRGELAPDRARTGVAGEEHEHQHSHRRGDQEQRQRRPSRVHLGRLARTAARGEGGRCRPAPTRRQARDDQERQRHAAEQLAPVLVVLDERLQLGPRVEQRLARLRRPRRR